MDPVTATVRTVDLPLGAGRQTLRLILHVGPEGEPEALSLALGFGGHDGSEFRRPGWGDPLLSLPASVMGPLRDALKALAPEPEETAT